MSPVTMNAGEYLTALSSNELDKTAEYTVKGNIELSGKHSVTLKNVTVNGSVTVGADCEDVIIYKCQILGDITCAATNAVIKECRIGKVSLFGGATNVLVAKCDTEQISVTDGYNCTVLLNNADAVSVTGGTSINVIKNTVSGEVTLHSTAYLLCDENTVHGKTVSEGLINHNGDNVRDINERPEFGANEELLPHVNKDLFLDMPRREYVLQAEYDKPMTFNEYFIEGAKSGSEVIIPPAVYSVTDRILATDEHSNTVIYAYGAMREKTDYGIAIDFEKAEHFELRGLTLGYAKQSSGQIHVLEKLPDYRLRVINAAGYDYGFSHTDFKKYAGSTEVFHQGKFTNTFIFSHPYYSIPEQYDDKTFIIEMQIDKDKLYNNMEKGDVWSCRMAGVNTHTFLIKDGGNILFKDITVYGYGAALGLVAYGTKENVNFIRVCNTSRAPFVIDKETYDRYKALEAQYGIDLEVSIDEMGRYRGSIPRTGSVDAMHIVNGDKGVNATCCLFEHMCDDGSNQHSASSRLHRLIDNGDGTTTLVYKGLITPTRRYVSTCAGETEGHGSMTPAFRKGDRVFSYTSNGRVVCDAEVLDNGYIFSDEIYQLMSYDYEYKGEKRTLNWSCKLQAVKIRTEEVNFKALEGYDLNDDSAEPDHRIIVDNVSRASGDYTFDNVLVTHTRARGIAVKSRNVTVKNCTFRELGCAGVMLSCEEAWAENTVAVNTTVQRCLFDNTGRKFELNHDMKFGAFAIEGLGGLSRKVKPAGDEYACSNVLLEDSLFINNSHDFDIAICEAQNVTVRNNVFKNHVTDNGEEFLGVPVKATTCYNLVFEGNKFSPLSEGKREKIFSLENCSKVIFDGEVIAE